MDMYITPSNACRELGIGIHVLRGLAWDGVISTVKVAGKTMLYTEDVLKLKERPKVIAKATYKESVVPKDPGKTYGLPNTSNSDVYK